MDALPISETGDVALDGHRGVDTWIVVPCYDEASRLDVARFERFARAHPWLGWLFVNDGSRDRTLERITELARRLGERGRVLDLVENQGKAEAVRLGLLDAMSQGAPLVGYLDADLATPPEALVEMRRAVLGCEQRMLVMGIRCRLLGRSIRRAAVRRWLGTAFARAASLLLGRRVTDTQCGAKVLRVAGPLQEVLMRPFTSRWIFDLELLLRLRAVLAASGRTLEQHVYEWPLDRWDEIAGSKVRPRDFARAFSEWAGLAWRYRILTPEMGLDPDEPPATIELPRSQPSGRVHPRTVPERRAA